MVRRWARKIFIWRKAACCRCVLRRSLGGFVLIACLPLALSCAPARQSSHPSIAAPFRSSDQLLIRVEVYRDREIQGLAHSRRGAISEGWAAGRDEARSRGCGLEGDWVFCPIIWPITYVAEGAAHATIEYTNGVNASGYDIELATSAIRQGFQPQQIQPEMQDKLTSHFARQLGVNEAVCGPGDAGWTMCRGRDRSGAIFASFAYDIRPSKSASAGNLDIVVTVSAAAQPAEMFKLGCTNFEYRRPIGHLLELSRSSALQEALRSTVGDIAPIVASALVSGERQPAIGEATITTIPRRAAQCLRVTEFARESL